MLIRRAPIVFAYAAAAVGALLWHAFIVPWNWGGIFIQAMLSCFGMPLFVWIDFSGLVGFHRNLCYAMIISCCLLWFGYAYFAPQAVAPFTIMCFILIFVWGTAKKTKSKLLTTLLLGLPLIGLGWYGLDNTLRIYRLRHLSEPQVREIQFTPNDGGIRTPLTSEAEIASFIATLRQTTPYLPNHERLNSPWQARIVMKSGETIYLDIGKGTRSNANTCRIQLGVTSYQNEALCGFLHSREPRSF
jgi:hypothetical protein